ncbi:MAG: hypothetical protein ACYCS8_19700, partial [Acidithiobacillus sp.]
MHHAEQIAEAAQKQVERLQSREDDQQVAVTHGEVLAGKIRDAISVAQLEAMFGTDEALGVRFVDHQGNQIPMTMDADGQSVFPDGTSAVICTDYAEQVKKHLSNDDVQIVGFSNEENPDCAVVREEWHPGGHDLAIVDQRWLVDPWARLVASVREQIIYDLQDPGDARKIAETYGDPLKWTLSGTSSIGHASSLDSWDRTGLDEVIDAYESIRRNAMGITITKAAIIPTRSGVIAVPKEENLPVYIAGQPDSAPVPTEMTVDPWLAGIAKDFREAAGSVLSPFTALSARVKDVTLTAARMDHRMLNADLEAPESLRNGQILLHTKIEDATQRVVESEWSLSISREAVSNKQLYDIFLSLRDQGLLESLRSVDRIQADYGHVMVSGILGRDDITEIMACQGLQPLRLLLTVEPDDESAEMLDQRTGHLVDRLRDWRTDFPNTPVVIDVLSTQGCPEPILEHLRTMAELVHRIDAIDPEAVVRQADLTAQIGAPCEWTAPVMGRNFRSQQKKDLVKPMLVIQPDQIEVRLENLLPGVLDELYQRNVANNRQMELQGILPLSRTQDALALQTSKESLSPAKEASIQNDLLKKASGLANPAGQTPSAGPGTNPDPMVDADWQRLRDLPVTVPKVQKPFMDQRLLLDQLVQQGIPLSLFQEPSSVNCVMAILESGELSDAGVQVWSVQRSDLVAQDAELRELRFFNGDPEQRHVFLLVGDRFLFDPWMAMSKPEMPYVLDVQNPMDRDILIDRYLSPAFWTCPHPTAVLPSAWRELERWNPDLQAFMTSSDDETEISAELHDTTKTSTETIAPFNDGEQFLPKKMVTEPSATPESLIQTQTIVAAPKDQEDIMDWKSLSETPEIRPELA